MRVAGLFAGIGGFELGLQRSGHRAEILCDVLPAAREVLTDHFPESEYHHDIARLRSLPSSIDLICGGFPCQDLSQAGLAAGIQGERSGLVAEIFRLLSRRKVSTVVLENVPFMLQLNRGHAIRAITAELERRGYRWAYRVVDTYGFGLPQRRERVFIVASTFLDPAEVLFADEVHLARPQSSIASLAHGFYWTEGRGGLGWAVDAVPTLKNGSTIGIPSPPAILLPGGEIVKPGLNDVERMQGFAPDWTIAAERVDRKAVRWSLVGSAVSVPVAQWLGKRLAQPGKMDRSRLAQLPSSGAMPKAAMFDGKRIHSVRISADPLGIRPPHLTDFLDRSEGTTPLSLKATLGFLRRTRTAKLKFVPGFIEAVERHAVAMGALPDDMPRRQLDLIAA